MARAWHRFIAAVLLAAGEALASHTQLQRDVYFLASAGLEGRRAGTLGAQLAAFYIAERFASLGLEPAFDQGYFQQFSFVAGVTTGPLTSLAFSGALTRTALPEEFHPLPFSAPGEVQAELVFAGYGIAAPEVGWDDYAGLDVKGKAVLLLRHSPAGDDPHSPYAPYLPLRRKVSEARQKGAVAVLVATGPATLESGAPVKVPFDYAFADAGIPAVAVSTALAGELFAEQGFSLRELQERMNSRKEPASRPLGVEVRLACHLQQERATAFNVVGVLPGTDPALGHEVVLVGAHYDHLGWGGPGSGSLAPDQRAIHKGADDNASGVAALLEIARNLKARPPKRSVLFAAFSAEELGLLGSSHLLQNLPVPREWLVAMVNLDMVGRPQEGKKLTLGGFGTAQEWPELLRLAKGWKLQVNTSAGGFGASDHSTFYAAGIPVLFFFTGAHQDYHRPSDTAEKLDYGGLARVAGFAAEAVRWIANRSQRPTYLKVQQEELPRRSFRVRTGLIPEYAYEGVGLKLSGVRGGSPAEKAGLQTGDIIVRFGDREVRNIYDYMYALGDHKAGETVVLTVQRGGQLLQLSVTLEGSEGGRS